MSLAKPSQSVSLVSSVPQGVALATSGRLNHSQTEALARFHLALCVPRDWPQVGAQLLQVCGDPAFAKEAFYQRSIGGEDKFGLNIRFAEKALQVLRNVATDLSPEHEDEHAIHYRLALTDTESNSLASETFRVSKTIESREAEVDDDQVVVSERTTKGGEKIYVVLASDDQLAARMRNLASRVKRGLVLGLLPVEIRVQCLAKCLEVSLAENKQDPAAATKEVLMTFLGLGLDAAALKEYLGKPLQAASEKELTQLRGLASALREGEVTWAAALSGKRESETKKSALTKLADDKKKQKAADKAKAAGAPAGAPKARGRRSAAATTTSGDGAGIASIVSDGDAGTASTPPRARASRHDDDEEEAPESNDAAPPNGAVHTSPS